MIKNSEMAFQRLNATIPEETMDKLKKQAKKENRPLSNMIRHMIEEYVKGKVK